MMPSDIIRKHNNTKIDGILIYISDVIITIIGI